MKSGKKIYTAVLFFLLLLRSTVSGGAVGNDNFLREEVEYLSSPACEGRASFTKGGSEAAFSIIRNFSRCGLVPICKGTYSNSCITDGKTFHNIVGMIPSNNPDGRGRYLFFCAHYDGVGTLGGQLYPGADSNASGVASLIYLAGKFAGANALGKRLDANIVFVATDGKQHSLGGARGLLDSIEKGTLTDPYTGERIKKEEILMFANIDILGGIDSPVYGGRKDYLIMLGEDIDGRSDLMMANFSEGMKMDLCFDYYGSESFTDLFLKRVSDQKPFLENKIPCVMFTSGISMNTNKTSDNISTIDFDILQRRTELIFLWAERFVRRTNTKE